MTTKFKIVSHFRRGLIICQKHRKAETLSYDVVVQSNFPGFFFVPEGAAVSLYLEYPLKLFFSLLRGLLISMHNAVIVVFHKIKVSKADDSINVETQSVRILRVNLRRITLNLMRTFI